MSSRGRAGFLATAVTVAAALPVLFASTAGAGDPDVTLKISKHADGPFVSAVTVNLAVGEKRSVYLKAKNTTGSRLHPLLGEESFTSGYKTRYFRNEKNITAEVKADDYDLNLRGGKAKVVRLRVKAEPDSPGNGCVSTAVDLDAMEVAFTSLNLDSPSGCT